MRDGSGSPGGGLNGSFYLSANSTVQDDGDVDIMIGGNARDWFFANLTDDSLSDLEGNEWIDELL